MKDSTNETINETKKGALSNAKQKRGRSIDERQSLTKCTRWLFQKITHPSLVVRRFAVPPVPHFPFSDQNEVSIYFYDNPTPWGMALITRR